MRFEEAAAAYERLGHDLAGARVAPQALAEAVRLRLGLGELEQARADAKLLDERTGMPTPISPRVRRWSVRNDTRASVSGSRCAPCSPRPCLFSIGAWHRSMIASGCTCSSGAPWSTSASTKEASIEHRRVLDLAKRAPVGVPGADAVGEARFFFAEEAHRAASAIVRQPYQAPTDRKAIVAYLTGPVARWFARRKAAVDAAERAYLRVFGVEVPEPPPPPPPPPPGGVGLLSSSSGGDPTVP